MNGLGITAATVGILGWFVIADAIRHDAARRGRDGGLWGLASLSLGPLAWLVWLRERGATPPT